MATIKSYTNLQQSKKLAEILPTETSDMIYTMVNWYNTPFVRIEKVNELNEDDICAWSLAALLDTLPSATLDSSNDHYYRLHCMEIFTEWHNNPVDVCYELILKLNELNLL